MTKMPRNEHTEAERILFDRAKSENQIIVNAKPGKSITSVISYSEQDTCFIIELKARPVEGKANNELLKYIRKITGHNFEIISGASSKRKVLKRL